MTTPRRRGPSPTRKSPSSKATEPMPEPVRWRGPDRIARVAVIGAGLIGAGWVAAFLARGLAVAVCDPSPEAPKTLRAHLARVAPGADPAALSFHGDPGEAVAAADFVQEN